MDSPRKWRFAIRVLSPAAVPLALLLVPTLTLAATIHVPGDEPTIQAGIDAASSGDTVLVACGTYYEHDVVMRSGICLRSEAGDRDCVTIDAQQLGRVMRGCDLDETTRLEGLTLQEGRAWAPNPDSLGGGGMVCVNSSPLIVDCRFMGNYVSGSYGSGGGLLCRGSSPTITGCAFEANGAYRLGGGLAFEDFSSPSLAGCDISENWSDDSGGGGLYLGSGSSALITSATFTSNRTGIFYEYDANGGAIWIDEDCSAHITLSSFATNHAGWYDPMYDHFGYGGAIYCLGALTVEGCSFSGNGARSGWNETGQGGAIYAGGGSEPVIRSCAFSQNFAFECGGAIRCSGGGVIEDCVFEENRAEGNGYYHTGGRGGALDLGGGEISRCIFMGNNAELGGAVQYAGSGLIEGCLFAGNYPDAHYVQDAGGGAIRALDASLLIRGSTFAYNDNPHGGCLRTNSSVALENCILAFSRASEAVVCVEGGEADLSCCDVYGNAGGDWVGCLAGQYGVNGNFRADPLFCDPDNGDFRLSSDSPCVVPLLDPACGDFIGAYGVGCGTVGVARGRTLPTTWGLVKSAFELPEAR